MTGKSALESLISEALQYAWSAGRVKVDDLWHRITHNEQFAQALNAFMKVRLKGVEGHLYEPNKVYKGYVKQRLRNGLHTIDYSLRPRDGRVHNVRKFGSYRDTDGQYVYVAMRVMTEAELRAEQAQKHGMAETYRAQRDFLNVLIRLMQEAKAQTAAGVWDQAVRVFEETWS